MRRGMKLQVARRLSQKHMRSSPRTHKEHLENNKSLDFGRVKLLAQEGEKLELQKLLLFANTCTQRTSRRGVIRFSRRRPRVREESKEDYRSANLSFQNTALLRPESATQCVCMRTAEALRFVLKTQSTRRTEV